MPHDASERDNRTQFIMNGTLVESNLGLNYDPDTRTYAYTSPERREFSFSRFLNNTLEIRVRAYGEDATWYLESPNKWNLHYRNGVLRFENISYDNTWLEDNSDDKYSADFKDHGNDSFDYSPGFSEVDMKFRISYNLKHNDYTGLNWALDKYINDFWITWKLLPDSSQKETFRVHINGKYLADIKYTYPPPTVDKWRGFIDYSSRVKYEKINEDGSVTIEESVDPFTQHIDTWKYLNMHGGGRNAVFGHVMLDNTNKDWDSVEERDTYSKKIHDYYMIDNTFLRPSKKSTENNTDIGPYGPILADDNFTGLASHYNNINQLKEFYQYHEKFDQYAFGLTRHDLVNTWVGADNANLTESFLFFKPVNQTWGDFNSDVVNNSIWKPSDGVGIVEVNYKLDDLTVSGERPYFYPSTKPIPQPDQTQFSETDKIRLGINPSTTSQRPYFENNDNTQHIPLNSWEAMWTSSDVSLFGTEGIISKVKRDTGDNQGETLYGRIGLNEYTYSNARSDLNKMMTDDVLQANIRASELFGSNILRYDPGDADLIYGVYSGIGAYTDDRAPLKRVTTNVFTILDNTELTDLINNIANSNVDAIESHYTFGVSGIFEANLEAMSWNYTDANIGDTIKSDEYGENITIKNINPSLAYVLPQNTALYKYFPPVLSNISNNFRYIHGVNEGSENVFSLRFRMNTMFTGIDQVQQRGRSCGLINSTAVITTLPKCNLSDPSFVFNPSNAHYLMDPNISFEFIDISSSTVDINNPIVYNEQEFVNGNINTNWGPELIHYDPDTLPFKFCPSGSSKRSISSFRISGGLDHLYLNKNRYFDEGTTENSAVWVGADDKSETAYTYSSWSLVFDGESSNISFYTANLEYPSGNSEFTPSSDENADLLFRETLDVPELAYKNPKFSGGGKGPLAYKLNNGEFYNSMLDFVLTVEFAQVVLYCNGVKIVTGSVKNGQHYNWTGTNNNTPNQESKNALGIFNQIKIVNTTKNNNETKLNFRSPTINGIPTNDFPLQTAPRPLIIDLFEFTRGRAWKQHYLEVVSNPFISPHNNLKYKATDDNGDIIEDRYTWQPPPWFPYYSNVNFPDDNTPYSDTDGFSDPILVHQDKT